ncbi:MAG TPA: hypothetical protein VK826_08880 [Bacteroidia bacterium]|nr:hypothetical protein [Bacteroidia bacterium]
MKDDFENVNVDVEQLLRSKSWSQLNEAERSALKDLVDGEEEYERMQSMVHRLRAVSGVHDSEIPSGHVRENLLVAFDHEQRRRRGLWLTGIGFWFRDRLRFDIPAVRFAVAGVVVLIGIVTVVKLMNGENAVQPMAKQDQQTIPSDQNGNDPQLNPAPVHVDSGVVESPVVNKTPQVNDAQQGIQVTPPAPAPNIPAPFVPVDTTTQRLAINQPVDTGALVMPLVTATQSFAVCCGATNVVVAPTALGASNYAWTAPVTNGTVLAPSSYNITIVGLPPRSRSLEQDADVVNVFFALK